MKRLDQLTVTRFVAALSVVLYHSGDVFPFNRSPFTELFTSGPIAVNYFFALSGFVMSLAYYRPEKKLDVGSYYLSRFSRIYPVYLLSFLLTCLHYIDLMAKVDSRKILANLFLVQAWLPEYVLSFNYVAWSLSVEMFFYALFPFLFPLFFRLPVRKLIWYSVIFWGASIILHTSLLEIFQGQQDYVLYYNPLLYLSGFILGSVAGVWYLQLNKEQIRQPINLILLSIGLGLFAFVLIIQGQLVHLPAFMTLTTGLLTPVFVLIIFTLALDTGFISRILSHKWMVLLGDISYTLFILNLPMRWMTWRAVKALHLEPSNNLFNYIYIPFLILFSIFVYRKFERPARDWLLANRQMIRLFVWDVIFISLAVGFAYLVRFGGNSLYFDNWRLFMFTLRLAIPVVMTLLLLFRLYQPEIMGASGMDLARQIIVPILLGGLLLSGVNYWAFQNEIISTFARSVLLICFVTLFFFTWLSRFLFSRWAAYI